MNALLQQHLSKIDTLCREHGVRSLQAFGSVLRPDFRVGSDIDLLVDFYDSDSRGAFDRFFGFKEAMEQLLNRPVDLITRRSVANPYFKKELEKTSQPLYAA